MKNRDIVPRDQRPPLPEFAPVPRKCPRHDGWTPERQRAFIEALADTGSVATAARMVNMAQASVYALRRLPGADGFRAAWNAALDMGLQVLKDEAFERAMQGQLVPVFQGGKLMGYKRVKNDRLLMFCLRHYGQDNQGRRTTINYFSTKAMAANAQAEASTTTIKTVVTGVGPVAASPGEAQDASATLISGFAPADLDETAQAEILRALEACAERRRATAIEDDAGESFVHIDDVDGAILGMLEGGAEIQDITPFRPGELGWEGMGEGGENAEIETVLAGMAERAGEASTASAPSPADYRPT